MGLNDPDGVPDNGGPEECQKPENHTFLTGADDWSRLRFSRHGAGGLGPGPLRADQPSETKAQKPAELASLIDGDGDGIDDDKDVCPAVKDPGQQDADDDGLGDACLVFITQRDVDVKLEAASANLPIGEEREVTVTVANAYPKPATGVAVGLTLPAGVESVGGTPRWEVGEIPARGSKTLTLRLMGVTAGRGDVTAEVLALNEPDWDSTPGNHEATEDDQASKRFTVFAGGTQPTLEIRNVQLREGDDGERTARVRIGLDENAGGASVSAHLKTADRTATAARTMSASRRTSRSGRGRPRPRSRSRSTATSPTSPTRRSRSSHPGRRRDAGDDREHRDDPRRRRPARAWAARLARLHLARLGAGGSCPQRERVLAAPSGDRALTPDGRFLFVPDTNRIVGFTRDADTGEPRTRSASPRTRTRPRAARRSATSCAPSPTRWRSRPTARARTCSPAPTATRTAAPGSSRSSSTPRRATSATTRASAGAGPVATR